jgi:hypothetical protein
MLGMLLCLYNAKVYLHIAGFNMSQQIGSRWKPSFAFRANVGRRFSGCREFIQSNIGLRSCLTNIALLIIAATISERL